MNPFAPLADVSDSKIHPSRVEHAVPRITRDHKKKYNDVHKKDCIAYLLPLQLQAAYNRSLNEKPSIEMLGALGRMLYDTYVTSIDSNTELSDNLIEKLKSRNNEGFDLWVYISLSFNFESSLLKRIWLSFDLNPPVSSTNVNFPGAELYKRWLSALSSQEVDTACEKKRLIFDQSTAIRGANATIEKTVRQICANYGDVDPTDETMMTVFQGEYCQQYLTPEIFHPVLQKNAPTLNTYEDKMMWLNMMGCMTACNYCKCCVEPDILDPIYGDCVEALFLYGHTTLFVDETKCPLCTMNAEVEEN